MSEAEKVNKKSQDLTHEEYIQAADYWKQKDAQSVKMDRETLEKEVEAYIQENNTCALATGAGEFVRCTPVEYSYHDGAFWIFSEGGEKFAALKKNKQNGDRKGEDHQWQLFQPLRRRSTSKDFARRSFTARIRSFPSCTIR